VENIGLLVKPLNSATSSHISERGSILQKATTIFQCGCAGILDIMVTAATWILHTYLSVPKQKVPCIVSVVLFCFLGILLSLSLVLLCSVTFCCLSCIVLFPWHSAVSLVLFCFLSILLSIVLFCLHTAVSLVSFCFLYILLSLVLFCLHTAISLVIDIFLDINLRQKSWEFGRASRLQLVRPDGI
jgi:hypothetical protein